LDVELKDMPSSARSSFMNSHSTGMIPLHFELHLISIVENAIVVSTEYLLYQASSYRMALWQKKVWHFAFLPVKTTDLPHFATLFVL
jgi:hypothetical protein